MWKDKWSGKEDVYDGAEQPHVFPSIVCKPLMETKDLSVANRARFKI